MQSPSWCRDEDVCSACMCNFTLYDLHLHGAHRSTAHSTHDWMFAVRPSPDPERRGARRGPRRAAR